MNSNTEITYILSPAELMVLFAGKDMEGVIAIQQEFIEMDQRKVCVAVANMYEKKVLTNEDGEFVIDKPLDDMLETIKNAKNVLLFREADVEKQIIKAVYVGEQCVCMERSNTDASAFKIYVASNLSEEIFLEDDNWINRFQYRLVLDEEDLEKTIFESGQVLEENDFQNLPNIIRLVELVNPQKNKVSCRLVVVKGEEEDLLFFYNQDNLECEKFEYSIMDEKINQMVEIAQNE